MSESFDASSDALNHAFRRTSHPNRRLRPAAIKLPPMTGKRLTVRPPHNRRHEPRREQAPPAARFQHASQRILKRRVLKQGRVRRHRHRWLVSLLLVAGCWLWLTMLFRAPIWQVSPDTLQLVSFSNTKTGANAHTGFITEQHVHAALDRDITGQHLLRVSPVALAQTLKSRWSLIDQVSIQKSFWPAGVRVGVSEKPIWAISAVMPTSRTKNMTKGMTQHRIHVRPLETGVLSPQGEWFPRSAYAVGDPAGVDRLKRPVVLLPRRMTLREGPPQRALMWQRLYEISQSIARTPGFELKTLDVRQPQNIIAWVNRARWPDSKPLRVQVGPLDVTTSQRIARFPWLASTLNALGDQVSGVDLRWDKQVTLQQPSLSAN